MRGPDRRSLLRAVGVGGLALAGLGTGGSLLAGCDSGDGGSGAGGGAGGSAGPSPTASPAAMVADADWVTLEGRLKGPLLRPGNPDFVGASQLFDPAFDGVRPQALARAATAADVAACVSFAREHGLPVTARAGGHSYGGYSTTTGLVVDVSPMAAVSVKAGGVARIGAGAQLVDVYAGLAGGGRALPAGSCPTVGIAGLSLGGGIGVLGRRHGLTCDRMLSAEVVLASGETVRTDANREPELFWALRGAGGGNVGIVTSFTFATHEAVPLVLFTCRWPWDAASDVVGAWQRWISEPDGAPDTLWSSCAVSAAPTGGAGTGTGGTVALRVSGVSCGGAGDADVAVLRGRLAALADASGHQPTSTSVSVRDHLSSMLYEAGCAGRSVPDCHLRDRSPGGTLSRVAQRAASAFLLEPMASRGVEALVNAVEQRRRLPGVGSGGVLFDAWGGEINRVAPGDTAFVHRSAIASAQYVAGYSINADAATKAANERWLRSTVAAAAPYVSRSAYQNYIDPGLADWAQAYYGANLDRLRRVKGAYDPADLFHFAQGIAAA